MYHGKGHFVQKLSPGRAKRQVINSGPIALLGPLVVDEYLETRLPKVIWDQTQWQTHL